MNYFNSVIIFDQNQSNWLTHHKAFLRKIDINYTSSHPDIIYIDSQTGWGIDQIRYINKLTNTPPIKSQNRLITIFQAENLTTESQNSLLKTIEEPPAHNYFLLLTGNMNLLLDTIKSRCHIIKKSATKTQVQKSDLLISQNLAKNLEFSTKVSKDKQQTINLIKNQITKLQNELVESPQQQTVLRIRLLSKSLDMINSNVNPTSALDFFYLGLS